ncbi:MAG TPA: ABC transporter substrate-binding protein [Candidatus Binatia bacterium]
MALLFFLLLGGFDSAVAAADKIRLSISSVDMSFLTPAVSLKRGFFKEEGLDAEIIRMNANVSITALATGDLDYTMIFGSVVRGAVRGLPMKVVASFMDGSTHTVIARPEFKSIKDLKSRTLGVSSFGATADVAARMIFKSSGIDPEKEIKIIALGSDQARFAALKEGIVDVAIISPPADVEGKKLGFNVLARAYEVFKLPFIGLGANHKKIKERPDEIKRTLKALIRGNRYITANREGAVQVLMEWSKTDRESAALSYDATVKVFNVDGSIPESGLKLVIEPAKQALKVERPVSFDEVADLGPLREAQKELGVSR